MEEGIPGDASTLIYLAKANVFERAHQCVSTILVSPSVWREAVDQGERIGALGIPHIRAAADAGSLRLVELSEREEALASAIAGADRLGAGEQAVELLWRLAIVIGPRAEVVYAIEQHLRTEEA